MFNKTKIMIILLTAVFSIAAGKNGDEQYFTDVYKQWKNGPPADPDFFPIAVWLQSVDDAAAYKAGGINTFVALREGPKPGEIEKLNSAGIYLICDQNEAALAKKDDKTIIAWKGENEPDNAQKAFYDKNYASCTKPSAVIAGYQNIKRRDPSRPVLAFFGQGLVIDNYEGRGPGAGINDYKDYFKGGDIISFNIYPVAGHGSENLLWYQGKGLDRITEFAGADKIKWNFIETESIRNPSNKPTPANVKAEVWMSIIHGSKGIVYYCQQFKPAYDFRALLTDKDMFSAVTDINKQIKELAPVINSPDAGGLTVTSGRSEAAIKAAVKKYKGDTYIFAMPMRNGKTTGNFKLSSITEETKAEVLGEARFIKISGTGTFNDVFEPWQVHLYKIVKK